MAWFEQVTPQIRDITFQFVSAQFQRPTIGRFQDVVKDLSWTLGLKEASSEEKAYRITKLLESLSTMNRQGLNQ